MPGRPSNAGFELQIGDVPHGQEDLIYLYGLPFEVQNYPQVVQGLLANNEVIHWWLSPWVILHNIWLKENLLAGKVLLPH